MDIQTAAVLSLKIQDSHKNSTVKTGALSLLRFYSGISYINYSAMQRALLSKL